jgi:hypothetical protein
MLARGREVARAIRGINDIVLGAATPRRQHTRRRSLIKRSSNSPVRMRRNQSRNAARCCVAGLWLAGRRCAAVIGGYGRAMALDAVAADFDAATLTSPRATVPTSTAETIHNDPRRVGGHHPRRSIDRTLGSSRRASA